MWTRKADLGGPPAARRREVWEYWEGEERRACLEMDVTIGKPLEVLALKGTAIEEVRQYANFLQKTAADLYAPTRGRREVRACPCCEAKTAKAVQEFAVFGIPYHRCRQCGHVFVRSQPTLDALNEVFQESEEHSAVYTDRQSLEVRLQQIIKPKADWLRDIYQRHYGWPLTSAVDVGAGGGHFVEGLRRAGIRAEGFELSRSSRRFAQEVFGIELAREDFLAISPTLGEFDAVTFWGLLEYTPQPRAFLTAASRWLDPARGMLVVEVPRFDCLGTAIQKECPATIARHLDPSSHVNCFSDTSLATVLFTCGFKPIAAWYFGMDAYELVVQLAALLDAPEAVGQLAHLIPGLQASFDSALLCDDIIVAAVPLT